MRVHALAARATSESVVGIGRDGSSSPSDPVHLEALTERSTRRKWWEPGGLS
jgi:hypothetical protein